MLYTVKKLFSMITTLLLVSLLIFLMFNVIPGNPAQAILGIDADPQQLRALEMELGLDKSIFQRYFEWIVGVIQGDFGISYRYRQPVAQIIADRFPVTLSLTVISLAISAIIAIPLGLFISRYEGTLASTITNAITLLGISTPSFWLAFILLYLFAGQLGWFPTFGYVPWSEGFTNALRSQFLPAFSMAIGNIAVIVRYLTNSVGDQLSQDYVITAEVKGLSPNAVLLKHVLKNASLPVITIVGLMIADTLGGSIIIENVFALPGLGSLLNTAVETRDFPLLQSLVMMISIIIIVANFIIDLLYHLIDPRIKLGGG